MNVYVEVRRADTGELVSEQAMHNLVVDTGLDVLRDALAGLATITHFGYGTGTTAVAAGDTTLEAEVFRGAVTQRVTSAAAQLVVKHFLTSASANGIELTEVGLFDAASGGRLFAHALLDSAISKTSAITVTTSWEVNFTAVAP